MRRHCFATLFTESVSRCNQNVIVPERMLSLNESRPVSLLDTLARCSSGVWAKTVFVKLVM